MNHKAYPIAEFKAVDEEQGVFEAIVSVFGNIDRYGDRVKQGAFENTLRDWEAKGRPIPVIFSHDWGNLDAHIGQVLKAEEVERGLYVKAQLDLEEDYARKVWKRMRKGTIAEFSFAYDVVRSKWVDNGEGVEPRYVTELEELELLEVGPCLFGVNPDTELISVRGLKAALAGEGRKDALQELHDMLVELGASCRGLHPDSHDDSGDSSEGPAKSEGGGVGDDAAKDEEPGSSTLAARVAIELMDAGIEV